ncbi:putative hydroxypyruvate isomerase isoform X2 [Protopterus annectens]|uniref:putative hydroxypyruvate isomerase isoform X2 n=1 Tax=Protopterus annectens TaxID=7888 RepID=UPI001CFB7C9D|nr:putative hydroxypyruvate isomerase isoform X2 [Protopterus annectens]
MRVAAAAGFQAVEVAFPYENDPGELARLSKSLGLQMVLINTPPGNPEKAEMGLGALPGRQADFRSGLELAVKYSKELGCKRIHIMAGRVPADTVRAAVHNEMEHTFIENLKYAADFLSKEGITGLVEPINNRISDPRYFLNSPHQAADILQKVGHPNLKLQMDVFHWQIMDGNLTQNIKTYFPFIDHIQIAQVPSRNEPDSPGEVNYFYIFSLLEELGYKGFIGCEYAPNGDTVGGLGWLRSYWKNHKGNDA